MFFEEEMECVCCPLCGEGNYKTLYSALDIKVSFLWFPVVKCTQCGLVYTNPRPSEKNAKKYYGNKYYAYQVFQANNTHAEIAVSGKNVLDIGCGSGSWLYHRKCMGDNAYGVEISSEAVQAGRRMGLNIFHGKLEEADFKTNFFDLINMNHVLEHVYSPLNTLREVNSILKTNGILTIEVPNIDSVESMLLQESWRHLDVPRHLWHFSPETLKKFLHNAGFQIVGKKMKSFPDRFQDIGSYLRCQYTTARLIFHRLKTDKKKPASFFVFASILKLSDYLFKYWTSRLTRRIRMENESLIQYQCVPNKK